MDAGHGSGGGRLAGSGGRALVGAQLRRVLVVGIVVPLAVGAVIALVGACWAYAAGAEPATMAMIAFTQAYPPVSYTHLDVYKRQSSRCSCGSPASA